ncbi:MAG: hypothetical protein BWY36_00875 [Candidatus Diapherotrites archaeon ADurb.Bin253]|nr:MAG: hypothetical protein BWY36_00875 [Candidatus Diapherotrites archaeon ADurb.Bin253]
MKLTGVFLIETGVVNRGDGIGNIATVKKITTPHGVKVYFSPQSYKRALWNSLQNNFGWSLPLVTKEGGVVQRTGTVIDSEEFDFGGTMIAKPMYQRDTVLYLDNGISINSYAGDMEFMTNMGIAKLYGENEANIINRENFYGLYLLPFGIEVDRIGVQELNIPANLEKDDNIEQKIEKIYTALGLSKQIDNDKIKTLVKRVKSIEVKNKKIVTITLTKDEKRRRLQQLLEAMGELGRKIEGSERNLCPHLAFFSLTYATPKYLLFIKDKLIRKEKIEEQDIQGYAKKDGKNIIIATHENYGEKIKEIIEAVFPN